MRPPPPAPPWAAGIATIGVTGTNGKTTTTTLIAAALARVARPVARVTTLGCFVDDERLGVPLDYRGFLAAMERCRDGGGRLAAIELTSEALALGFATAWPCRVGVFTNLTRDHLDAHGSAEHYLASKAQLFVHLPEGGAAVLNGCDPASALIAEVVPAGARVVRYGAPGSGRAGGSAALPLDVEAREVEIGWGGTRVAIGSSGRLGDLPGEITTRAIGEVFAEDALAALAAAVAGGVPAGEAAQAIAAAAPPPGRFEVVAERPHVVVDYAHTPDALARTLASARRLCAGRLWVVFGAGGDRDRAKRPMMGAAAAAADRIVLTSDNPRSEDPAAIAAAIREGLGGHAGVEIEIDRARAIAEAVRGAGEDDVIVIAGKGHEAEQVIGGARRRFSDQEVARAAHRPAARPPSARPR